MLRGSLLLLGIVALACGGGARPGSVPSASSTSKPTLGESKADASPADSPSAEPTGPGNGNSDPDAAPALAEDIANQCKLYCLRKAEECPADVAQRCLVDCKRYQATEAPCDGPILDALVCAQKQTELFCASVVSGTCGQKFKAYAACLETGELEKAESEAPGLPPGFVKKEDKALGFLVHMPGGAALSETGTKRIWAVERGDVTYQVGRFDAPKGSKKHQQLLSAATEFVGACKKSLKLKGNVEKADHIMMQFSSLCETSGGFVGTLRLRGDQIFVVAVRYAVDPPKDAEAFIYSFEFLP